MFASCTEDIDESYVLRPGRHYSVYFFSERIADILVKEDEWLRTRMQIDTCI
jgi:hypothetical protein